MLKSIHLAVLLVALGILFCGCSDNSSFGSTPDDSNLVSNMGMGMGGDSVTETEAETVTQYSPDNTPVPEAIQTEPDQVLTVPSTAQTNTGQDTKESAERSIKNAVLFCDQYNILLMGINDGQYCPITKDGNAETRYFAPSWTLPGNRVTFIKDSSKGSAICRSDADGSNAETIFTFMDRISSAVISPDGKRIAYCIASSGSIRIMNIDGSDNHLLVESKGSDPVWSPDGSKIAFAGLDLDNKSFIYTINPDGTDTQNLTNRFAICGRQPSWSPNGKRIVFSTGHNLCILEADGSGLTYLTNDDTKYRENPCWLANGTVIMAEYRMKQDGERFFCLIDVVRNIVKLINTNQSR